MKPSILKEYFDAGGDEYFRYKYDLNEDSIVLDVGGYQGMFAELIYDKFACNVFIFEPINAYYKLIEDKFSNNAKINVFNYGLSDSSQEQILYKAGDATSIYKNTKTHSYEVCKFITFKEALNYLPTNKVDLIKLNVEGSEFEILPNIIESSLISDIDNIQVQFHNINSDSIKSKLILIFIFVAFQNCTINCLELV